jgi:hypothetical protein
LREQSSENSCTKSKKSLPPPLSERGFSLLLLLSLKILRDWLYWRHYLIAQALQTPNQLPLDFAMICMPRKEGFPFLVIFLARFHHLIIDHQNAMTYRQGRSFTPSPVFEATIAFSQVRMRLPNTMSGLDQSRAQIPIAFSRPSTELLPCTLFLPWTDTGPRTQVLSIWKALEIRSDLCHQDVEHLPTHPVDPFTALDLLLQWAEMPFDLCFQVAA